MVVIGTDGVIRHRSFSSTFVPFSAIRRIVQTNSVLLLERSDAPPLELVDLWPPVGYPRTERDCFAEIVAMRIREAIANQDRTDATAKDERREMPIADWIQEIRDNPDKPPTYRIAPPRDNDHSLIFEDPTADVVTRACAAVALRIREGDVMVPRLRVAAAATASPKLRVALEKIADGAPDDEIARRIEKLR
jgi:hypothetical protein